MKKSILTAFAEPACGPGWSNTPVWVVLRDENGKFSVECIQPEDQTATMITLYSISSVVHRQMSKEAEKIIR